MTYGFFDYKYNIEGFTSDLFSTEHIVFIVLIYTLTFFVSFLLRRTKRERIDVGLKILSVAMVLLETAKISWESYYDITTGRGFNYGGLLPIYTCSLFIYTLLVAAWTRGKAREYCLSFITTISLLYGAIGVVYCNGLNYYPFWTFGAFYSLFFHSTMFAVGVFLLAAGYKKLDWIDSLRAMIPTLLLACVAVPVNHFLQSDYMMIYSGSGVPIYEGLAASLAGKGLRFIYTGVMLATHIPLALLVIAVYKAVSAAVMKKEPKTSREEEPALS